MLALQVKSEQKAQILPFVEAQDKYMKEKEYYRTVEKLAVVVYNSGWEFDHIVCIARGGTRIGDAFSRLFEKPVSFIKASSYRGAKGNEQSELILSEIAKTSALGKRILLVDDLADSGETLKKIKEYILRTYKEVVEVKTAVLWYKSCSKVAPDHYAEKVDGKKWIYQPFERYDEISIKELAARYN